MNDPLEVARARSLPRLRRALLRGSPRLAVAAMLAFTTLAGFFCSVALLHLGVRGMGLRYAVSVLVAYGVFLAQLRLWVAIAARRRPAGSRGGDGLDVSDVADVELPARWAPGGGRFAGGGASGTFDPPPNAIAPGSAPDAGATVGDSARGAGIDVDLDVDGEVLVAIVVVATLVASAAFAMGYIVYTAPTLLAEVLFDGAVAGVLYRRLRRGGAPAWWQAALSRTWVSALVVLVFCGIGGLIVEKAVPGARSIGDVLRAVAG